MHPYSPLPPADPGAVSVTFTQWHLVCITERITLSKRHCSNCTDMFFVNIFNILKIKQKKEWFHSYPANRECLVTMQPWLQQMNPCSCLVSLVLLLKSLGGFIQNTGNKTDLLTEREGDRAQTRLHLLRGHSAPEDPHREWTPGGAAEL